MVEDSEDSEDSVLSQLTSKTQIIIRGPSDRSVWARTSDGESAVFQVIKNYISSNNPISSKMISDGECYSIIQKVDEDNLVAIKLDNSNINVFDDNKISDSLFCRQLKETENSESVLSKLYTYLASKLSVIEQDNALLARYKFHLFNSSLTKKDILNQNIEKYFNENISQMSDDQILASIVRTMVTLNYVSNDTTSVRYKLIQTLIHSKQIDLLTLENIFDLMSLGAEIGIPQSIFNALIQLTQINSLEKSKMQGMLLDYGFNQKYLEMIFEVYNLKNNQEVYSLIENTEDIFWFTKLCCSGDMSNLNSEFINNVFTTIQEKEIGKLCNNTAVKIINYIIEHDKSSEKIIIKNTLNFMYSQNIKIPYDTFIEIFKSLDDASIKNYIYDKLLTNKPDVSDAETGYNDIHGVINHNNLFSDMSTFSTNDNSTKIIGIIDSLINSFDEII